MRIMAPKLAKSNCLTWVGDDAILDHGGAGEELHLGDDTTERRTCK